MKVQQQAIGVESLARDGHADVPVVTVDRLGLAADHDRVGRTELVLDGDLVHAETVGVLGDTALLVAPLFRAVQRTHPFTARAHIVGGITNTHRDKP